MNCGHQIYTTRSLACINLNYTADAMTLRLRDYQKTL